MWNQNPKTLEHMKSSFHIFLRRDGKRGHDELLVHIEWGQLSSDDVQKLAAFYVLHRVQDQLKGWDEKLPESVEYLASDFLHNEPLVQREFDIPPSWKAPPESKALKEAKKAFLALSPDDIRKLLEETDE